MACVDVVSFGVQILLQQHPAWKDTPVAVVSQNLPGGLLGSLNAAARAAGLSSGMRLSHGQSLCPSLNAGVVDEQTLQQQCNIIAERLRLFSPDVEISRDMPGVFWMNAAGLDRLYPTLADYAKQVIHSLLELGFRARVSVGVSRFGTFAMNQLGRSWVLAHSEAQEASLANRVSLSCFSLPVSAEAALSKLGVHTIGALLALPASGVQSRFPQAVMELYRWAKGESFSPLVPDAALEEIFVRSEFDFPDTDAVRLLFRFKHLLISLLGLLAMRKSAVSQLHIRLELDRHSPRTEQLCPAAPTLDEAQLVELVRLRFDALNLESGVVEMRVSADSVPAHRSQLLLFSLHRKRDVDAANRGIARIRARFGADAVVRAKCGSGHLPEAGFLYEPVDAVVSPSVKENISPALIRRIFKPARPLDTCPVTAPVGQHLPGRGEEPTGEVRGPYRLSGGWWVRQVERDYYFVTAASGKILWVYYDTVRRRWYLQGEVE